MKPKGSLAILAFGSKHKEPDEDDSGGEPDMDEDDAGDSHGAAFDAFADASGIPEDRRGEAQSALKQFVESCMREYGPKE